MLTDFQHLITLRLNDKFATNSYLQIPPHTKYVATLPCEISVSEKWRQSEIHIVINDKSRGSAGKHLSWGGIFHTNLSFNFMTKEFLKMANI